MTRAYDSSTKRTELVRAARDLFYRQGFHKTTLDNVAKSAGVPLGNVHYYFETKQSLAEAVIALHLTRLRETLASWEADGPQQSLQRMVRAPLGAVEAVIRFGCPHGSLCQELGKLEDSPLTEAGNQLLSASIDWAQKQLRALGWEEKKSRDVAEQLVASIQGTMLLAHTLGAPEMLVNQLGRVESWLEEEIQPRKERSLR